MYKRNVSKEAWIIQKKYDDGYQFTVTDLQKLFADRELKNLVRLKPTETWEELKARAKFARMDKYRKQVVYGDRSKKVLQGISRSMPDLAVELINDGLCLTGKEYMWMTHALERKYWKQLRNFPSSYDSNDAEWMLNKIHRLRADKRKDATQDDVEFEQRLQRNYDRLVKEYSVKST